MKKIIKKIGQAIQVVLLAPIKLPKKAMVVLKYLSVGLGVIETVFRKDEENTLETKGKEGRDEGAD